MTDEKPERGAAEERSDSPLTPTEAEASRTPPSQSSSDVAARFPVSTTRRSQRRAPMCDGRWPFTRPGERCQAEQRP
jgi:hypothetical protein